MLACLFTPTAAVLAQWGGSSFYEEEFYSETYTSDCFCDGWGSYLPSIGGCNYSPIDIDD